MRESRLFFRDLTPEKLSMPQEMALDVLTQAARSGLSGFKTRAHEIRRGKAVLMPIGRIGGEGMGSGFD